jgi:hypothetical protein
MTFVAAKCFGDRIVIAADTMISNRHWLTRNTLPGRLKIIIISPNLTIAFSGLLDQSVDTIKQARNLIMMGNSVREVEELLRYATINYEYHAGGMEFILASHVNGASLKRIWNGNVSEHLDTTCIGDRDLRVELDKKEVEGRLPTVPSWFEDELRFANAFKELFSGLYVSKGVGGFVIMVACSPKGHYYIPHGGVMAWDEIVIGQPVTERQLANRKSGMTQWGYFSEGPSKRGVGVVGCIIEDAKIGYIYSPLRMDKPQKWSFIGSAEKYTHVTMQSAFQQAIETEAALVGGGIDVFPSQSIRRIPTGTELAEVEAYALDANLPTQVQLTGQGVSISCGDPGAWRSCLADFHSLYPDPVTVLKTAIDRINTEVAAVQAKSS